MLLAAHLGDWTSFEASALEDDSRARWIIQFSSDASAALDSPEKVQQFFERQPGAEVLFGMGTEGQYAVRVDHAAAAACLSGESSLDWVQAENLVSGFATPDDPQFSQQHGLNNSGQNGGFSGADINVTDAWDTTTGSLSNVVAVIDSGIDYTHPDLFTNIWINQGEIPSALRVSLTDVNGDGLITFGDLNESVNDSFVSDLNANGFTDASDLLADSRWVDGDDTDGNGFVDDLFGWDFENNDNDPLDDHRHGTHVSGILGARGDNGIGIAGVNWDVQLMPLKFLNENNVGSNINAIRAIRYASTMRESFGVNVKASNNSWGSLGEPDLALRDAISDHGAEGILFVAGAGNGSVFNQGIDLDADSRAFYPASFDLDNIVSVAASDTDDSIAVTSNFGITSVDLSAPGVGILSTEPGGIYRTRNGTSMATPHVTGAALLVWANLPDATASEVKAALLESARAVGSSSGKLVSGGQVDAAGALAIDTFAPRASLTQAPDILTDGATEQTLEIQLRDNSRINTSSIDLADLRIVRRSDPDSPLQILEDSPLPVFPASQVQVTYRVAAPGGTWDRDDNGVYDITLLDGQVSDENGLANFEIPLGSFTVDIAFVGDIPLTTFADGADANPLDGESDDGNGNSTLRSAIQTANTLQGENTLVLESGTYTLTLNGADEDNGASGDLDIADDLTIIGNGAIIDAGNLDRVFDVSSDATLTLRGITLTGGNVSGPGGAIRSQGTVDISNATIHGNVSSSEGGAVFSAGTLTIVNTTVSTNSAPRGAGVSVTAGTADLLNVTVTNNAATQGTGGMDSSGSVTLRNTIVAGNTGGSSPDVEGSFSSSGHNLIGVVGSSSGLSNGVNNDLVGSTGAPLDAMLGPLRDNTGGLLTHVPDPESPAIDAGDNVNLPATDARGIDRVLDADRDRQAVTDIGAVEKNFGSIEGVVFLDRDGDGERHIAVDGAFTGIEQMTAVGDTLYFTFDDGQHGRELWKINDFGARLVRDIDPGSDDSDPGNLVDVGGKLFFTADNGFLGRELWMSDGTRDGTVVVKDIFSGATGSNPDHFGAVGNEVFFAADDGSKGVELWKSNGTPDGTVLVRDISTGASGSHPEQVTDVGGVAIFTADDGTNGREIWKSDGTAATTSLIANIHPTGSSTPNHITDVDGTLLFAADSTSGSELYSSRSPFDSVTLVSGFNANGPSNPRELVGAHGVLFLTAVGDNGSELFRSESPFETVTEVADIRTGASGSNPTQLLVWNDRIAFTADDGISGRELWTTSVFVDDAELLVDINPGALGSDPTGLSVFNGQLLFSAFQNGNPNDYWTVSQNPTDLDSLLDLDGLSATIPVEETLAFGDRLYIVPKSDALGLVATDGTRERTSRFQDVSERGFGGETVYLDENGNGVLDAGERSTQTFSEVDIGKYQFEFVSPDAAQVRLLDNTKSTLTVPVDTADTRIFSVSEWMVENGGDNTVGSSLAVDDSEHIGDFNGDGFDDLVVRSDIESRVIFGSANGIPPNSDFGNIFIDGTVDGFAIPGNAPFYGVGDFDADGLDDIASAEYLIYGSDQIGSDVFDTSQLLPLNGGDGSKGISFTNLGSPVGYTNSAGDVNGDGFQDLVLSDLGGQARHVVVFGTGSRSMVQVDLRSFASSDGSLGFEFQSTDDQLFRIEPAGDVNGDGFDDLMVGGADHLFVRFGAPGFPGTVSVDMLRQVNGGTGENGFVFPGIRDISADPEYRLGGDLNGDGFSDMVVVSNGAAVLLFGSSEPFEPEYQIDGQFVAEPHERIVLLTNVRQPISSRGDIDGDGVDDLVGILANGLVVVIPSSLLAKGLQTVEDGLADHLLVNFSTGQLMTIVDGSIVFESLGRVLQFTGTGSASSVNATGDLNGDGLADVLIEQRLSSRASIYYGRRTFPFEALGAGWQGNVFAGDQIRGINFGLNPIPGEIRGRAFRDLNNNSVKDAGEVGVGGFTIFIDENDNGSLDEGERSMVTDEEGQYSFTSLEALQNYIVRQVPRTGTEQTFPIEADDRSWTITLDGGQIFENVDFGNRDLINGVGTATVDGVVFDDVNGNGDQDTGEAGLVGRAVYLDLNDNGIREPGEPHANTDSSGAYSIVNLGEGVYNVRLDLSGDETLTTPRGSQFTTETTSPGEAPQAIESAEINGDQHPDLVVANFENNSVSVLLNDGAGNFTESIELPVGFAPTSVAIADLNGDSQNDLVVGHLLSDFVGVLLGDGNGNFGDMTRLNQVGREPRSVAIGDFDNSGGLDLVVTNQLDDSITVLFNDGTASFSSPVNVNVGNGPSSVAVGNMDGLLGPDIVVTNSLDNTISVVLHTGARTFFEPQTTAVGQLPFDVEIAHLDDDQMLDLAIANVLSDSITLLYGTSGGVSFQDRTDVPAGTGPSSVTAADLQGDGLTDLLVTNGTTQNLAVLRSLGRRLFEFPESYGVAEIPVSLAWATSAEDFNGDGVIDVAVANGDADSISIMTNQLTDGTYRIPIQGDETVLEVRFGVGEQASNGSTLFLSGGQTLDLSSADVALFDNVTTIDLRGSVNDNNTLILDAERIRSVFPGDTLNVVSDTGDEVIFDDGWSFAAASLVGQSLVRRFENSGATVLMVGPEDFTNPIQPSDVDGNSIISALDALRIINELARRRFMDSDGNVRPVTAMSASEFAFLDVTGDFVITARDALVVINVLARSNADSGEGERPPESMLLSNHSQVPKRASLDESEANGELSPSAVDTAIQLLDQF